jgi:hypothetical protein
MSTSDRGKARRGAFFGRRKGHALRPHQAQLFETLLPRLAIDVATPAPTELATLFPTPVDNIRLEIGFGGGEHLVAQAEQHAHTGFIGVEPFVNGMAKALAAINVKKLSNIRLHFAETTALEATLYPGRERRRRCAHPAAGRRVPFCNRHPGLRGVDAQAPDAVAHVRVDGRARRGLAPSMVGLFRNALRSQSKA